MSLFDIVSGPWAILPDKLVELQEVYAIHLRGERVDLAAVEARLGRPLNNEPKPFEVINGVAVIPVSGIIAPKASLFMDVSGGISTQRVQRDLEQAIADPSVKAVIMYLDTPGGSTLGTPELGTAIMQARAKKPVVAFTDGQMLSAGYWLGSAASAIYISGPTVNVGSIGVVMGHRDTSQAEAAMGIKTTEITAGKYKRITTQYEPLSTAGREHMQATVDYLYSLFVNAVADHRGVSVDQVLSDMADGRVFIGQQAIDAGLVDGYKSLNELIDQLAKDPGSVVSTPPGSRPKAISATTTSGSTEPDFISAKGNTMSTPEANQAAIAAAVQQSIAGLNKDTLQQGNPSLFAALQSEFQANGAAAERQRILDVQGQTMAGHEKLINTLMFDGKTTGPEAAVQVLAAHRAQMGQAAQNHFADAPSAAAGSASAAAAAASSGSEAKTREQKAAEASAYASKNNVDFATAYKELGFDE
jgi:signal peptide peptidase SppA